MMPAMLRFALALLIAAPLFAAPPNIVFFIADDLGTRDLGCYGSTFYETPNLDRLAKQGAQFSNAYAACPVCSPSRAGLITGQYPQRTGVTDYIGAAQPAQWSRNTQLLPAPYAERLALEEVTLAEVLKDKGFSTFFAGKWHLGTQGFWPENQGFDVNMGGIDRGGPYGRGKYFTPYDNPRLPDGPPGEHLPDRLANEANNFIETNKAKPFLIYFPFYDVHTPLQSRPDLQAKYEAKRKQLGLEPKFGQEPPRDVRLVQEHAVYAGMVEAMDAAVGKVLAKLDALGLAENTIVLFTSDNGGLSTSEGSPTSNLPYRGGKGWLYEGGIREPLIIRWPGKVKPGSTIDTPVCGIDLMPTLIDATAATPRPGQKLDGVSLVPLLTGAGPLAERPLFWHYPHYGNQGGAPGAAIRLGDWKLIEWFEGKTELFNLATDLSEKTDLSAQEPERVKTLLAQLKAWQADVGAKLPAPNPAYDPTKPTGRGVVAPKGKAKGKGKAK